MKNLRFNVFCFGSVKLFFKSTYNAENFFALDKAGGLVGDNAKALRRKSFRF